MILREFWTWKKELNFNNAMIFENIQVSRSLLNQNIFIFLQR